MKENASPPKYPLRFFRWFCHQNLRKYIEGDLMELYSERLNEYGKRKADWKFIIDVLFLFRPGIIRPASEYGNLNNYDMYRSYFKIAWRNLLKNRGFSFINIFGLSVGMSTCVMIMLYVMDEMSYDKHHADGHRIYRIAIEEKGERWVGTPAPVAEALKKDLPETEQVTRFLRFPGVEKVLLKYDQQQGQFFENNAYYVDSTFFEVFTYEFRFGDKHSALDAPNSIVLSEEIAARFFGDEDPVNKVLQVGLPFGEFSYTVKGVFRNTAKKSHIPSNLFLSMSNNDIGDWVKTQTNWATNNIFHTYVKLREGTDAKEFESKLHDFMERNGGKDLKESGFAKNFFIQPLEDIYLRSNFGFEITSGGNIRYLYVFTSIAIFLLVIACINFMNLSTARSERRAKEVGMRKAIGASKGSLVTQFLGESVLMSGLSLVVTIILVQLFIPAFNQLTQRELSLLQSPDIFIWLTLLALGTGVLSGLYPAFYLSSFNPVAVIKNKIRSGISVASIRKGLVVFQFTISIILILGAMLINQQMEYMSNQNLGFNKSQRIILPIQTNESNSNANTLKTELLNNSQVIVAAKGSTYPGIESINSMLFYTEGKTKKEGVDIRTVFAETDYVEALGIELLQGRAFSEKFTNDQNAIVLNEAAAKKLGYTAENVVGKSIYFEFQGSVQQMQVIGVVRDYHFESLHQAIKPLVLTKFPLFDGPTSYMIAEAKSTDYSRLIASLKETWSKVNPNSPFTYTFLDQDFQRNYEKEARTSMLIRYFTLIAIVIACLGLFGLATFTAEQRAKEIGVRKVLGASVFQIVSLLSGGILKLIAGAIIVASPIAYFIMNEWLQGFAYRINIEWWVFVVAGVTALMTALLTVSFEAVKAALMDPVKSLRSE